MCRDKNKDTFFSKNLINTGECLSSSHQYLEDQQEVYHTVSLPVIRAIVGSVVIGIRKV